MEPIIHHPSCEICKNTLVGVTIMFENEPTDMELQMALSGFICETCTQQPQIE